MNRNGLPSDAHVFRTSSGSWCVFWIFAGGLLALSLCVAFTAPARVPSEERIKLILAVTGVALLGVAWLRAYRLEISAEAVSYQSLFTRKRTILRRDIVGAEFAERTRVTEGMLIFVVRSNHGEIRVNVKPFPRAAFKELLSLAPGG